MHGGWTMDITRTAAAVLSALLLAACTSDTQEPAQSSATTQPQNSALPAPKATAPTANQVAGPVVWTCPSDAGRSGPTRVEKWDLTGGEVAELKTFSGCRVSGIPGPHRNGLPFAAQRELQFMDPSQTKHVRELDDNHVGFVDIKSGEVTDVTKKLVPSVGDFGTPPSHWNARFAPTGEFVFFDVTDPEAPVWRFIDLPTFAEVRTQNYFPGDPPGSLSSIDSLGFIGPSGEVEHDPGDRNSRLSIMGHAVCGNAIWWLNDRQYVTETDGRLQMATFGESGPGSEPCGQVLTPETSFAAAMAAPDGTVYFIIEGPNGKALYEANRSDPESPRKINFPLDQRTRYMFSGWSEGA